MALLKDCVQGSSHLLEGWLGPLKPHRKDRYSRLTIYLLYSASLGRRSLMQLEVDSGDAGHRSRGQATFSEGRTGNRDRHIGAL
jgi:hypothetical protein